MVTSKDIAHSFLIEANVKEGKEYRKYYQRVVKQSKKLSQIIVRSWHDDEKAQKIRKIFLDFHKVDTKNHQAYHEMEKLLTGKITELGEVCSEPVFDETEIDNYLIKIDWDAFEGSVVDNFQPGTNQKPPYFVLTVPYPPRPDKFNIDMNDESLQKWLKDKVEINNLEETVNNPFPPIPYLPQSTC